MARALGATAPFICVVAAILGREEPTGKREPVCLAEDCTLSLLQSRYQHIQEQDHVSAIQDVAARDGDMEKGNEAPVDKGKPDALLEGLVVTPEVELSREAMSVEALASTALDAFNASLGPFAKICGQSTKWFTIGAQVNGGALKRGMTFSKRMFLEMMIRNYLTPMRDSWEQATEAVAGLVDAFKRANAGALVTAVEPALAHPLDGARQAGRAFADALDRMAHVARALRSAEAAATQLIAGREPGKHFSWATKHTNDARIAADGLSASITQGVDDISGGVLRLTTEAAHSAEMARIQRAVMLGKQRAAQLASKLEARLSDTLAAFVAFLAHMQAGAE